MPRIGDLLVGVLTALTIPMVPMALAQECHEHKAGHHRPTESRTLTSGHTKSPKPTTITTSITKKPPKPTSTHTYPACGGFRIATKRDCLEPNVCIDDPYTDGCGMACDAPGICVEPVFCGGFAGVQCKDGKMCVDDPRDSCDPENRGFDCGGICV